MTRLGFWLAVWGCAACELATADDARPDIVFEKITLTKEFWSEGAAFGDFNRDGVMDVVAGPYWYEGPDFKNRHEYYPNVPYEKDGRFYGSCDARLGAKDNPKGPFPITAYSDNFFAFTGDFNRDGWTDIVIIGFPGKQTCWYENPQGKPGHWPRHVAFDVTDNESPGMHDLLGTGQPVLVCCSRGQYGYAKPDPNNPYAMWKWHPITPPGNYQRFTHGMGVGDVNGDGRPDLLEKDGWWEQPPPNSKEPTWRLHRFPFSEQGGAQMWVFDVNGDGRNDVVTSLAAHQFGLAWFENVAWPNGAMTFIPHLILGDKPQDNKYGVVFSQLHAVALADIDGDGVLDIVTGKRKWAHGLKGDPKPEDDAVNYWFRTVRTKSGVDFVPHRIDNNSGVGTQVVVGDVDGDGKPDVVVGNKMGAFVLLQRPMGKKTAAKPNPIPAIDHTTVAVDFRPAAGASRTDQIPASDKDGVLPKDANGKTLNLDFEKGTLEDWTASGTAFDRQPIEGDAVRARRADMQSRHQGRYWIGGYERFGDGAQGTLTSVPFPITHPFASFLVAGGPWPTTVVEIVLHEPGQRGDYVLYRVSGDESENLKRVVIDLQKQVGKTMFIRLVDRATGHWGHINFDDFRFHSTKPASERGPDPPKADTFAHAGLSPEDAARAMTLPEGFRATLFAGEPDVRQPIAFTLDDRGRLWVVEGLCYPIRRPEGQGRDRILIFEDADGDGKFDKRTVFMEGLNLVSGIEIGFGGVWLGAAPHLMFVPLDESQEKPAGPATILLDGWGWQDTHETLNAFQWGPDGWLYGCHGVFTHSKVGKPGTPEKDRVPINAGVWRYHPTRHRFEVFAHGTSNPWGVDWDDRGQCFVTACVIPHLFHMIQGGRYLRQAGQHFNPFTYDDIKEVCDHVHYIGPNPHGGNNRSDDAGGGHAHCGAMIYLGGAWPREYHNQIFMANVHGRRLNVNKLERKGSGYVGRRAPDFLKANDSSAQFINFRYGPDGNVYIIDWYDANRCHLPQENAHDRSNGRIYKVVYAKSQPFARPEGLNDDEWSVVQHPGRNPNGLRALSDGALVALTTHPNEFYVRKARRILQERHGSDASNGPALALPATDARSALNALWAMHAVQPIDARRFEEALKSPAASAFEHVRAWLVQLAVETEPGSDRLISRLEEMARSDASPVVRLYLASAAQRIAADRRWGLVAALLSHSEDAADHNLPLMYWYAAEPLADVDVARAMKIASEGSFETTLRFMSRKIASTYAAAGIDAVAGAIADTEDATKQRAMLVGLREALRGRRQVEMPSAWPRAFVRLRDSRDELARTAATDLAVTFGDPAAFAKLRDLVADANAGAQERELALATLAAAKDAQLSPMLAKLCRDRKIASAVLRAMANYDDPSHARAILDAYAGYSPTERRDALNTLAARKRTAHALLNAVAVDAIPASEITADLIRQLRNLKDADIEKRLNEVWGTVRDSPAAKARLIADYKRMLSSKSKKNPDVALGRAVFARTCQQCHKLFGVGDAVGPELTGSNRADLDYILSNILDPSAIMAKEYQPTIFTLADGRVVTGLVREENPAAIVVRTANETVTLPRPEIESTRKSDKSMMPDDQLKPMSEHEVRSLIAYLASPMQTPMLATAENVREFFNGKDLASWDGDMRYWSVENGEIVGKSPGIKQNQFLVNSLLLGDFKLKLEVKLTPDSGNSGIQFRSRRIEGTEMRGYQADVGKGWWGKLYEESARGMLVDKGGESVVKPNDWNRYEILAVGDRIQIWLNGQLTVDFRDPKGDKAGQIGLQIHSGPPMEVRFRNIELELAKPEKTASDAAN